MGFIARYVAAGALAVALLGAGWGWRQGQRADHLEAQLAAANTHIARLQAEAEAKGLIEHAVDQVQRLDGSAISDWLRARAGRN